MEMERKDSETSKRRDRDSNTRRKKLERYSKTWRERDRDRAHGDRWIETQPHMETDG